MFWHLYFNPSLHSTFTDANDNHFNGHLYTDDNHFNGPLYVIYVTCRPGSTLKSHHTCLVQGFWQKTPNIGYTPFCFFS